jgi:hypothetical protein
MATQEPVSAEIRELAAQLATAIIPEVSSRIARAQAIGGGFGIFECEDYKCDGSFTCTDYKCSGGGFKCNDTFKISTALSEGTVASA